jgi:molybdopterin/thiamine biosynthesis adenylyltransferase
LICSDEHRYHRQLGLVDQDAVGSMRVSLAGDTNLVLATLSQLVCAGVGSGADGIICIRTVGDSEIGAPRHAWVFSQKGEMKTWNDLGKAIEESHGITLKFGTVADGIHLECVRGGKPDYSAADLYATVWHGQAVLSKSPLTFNQPPNISPSMLDASLEIALGAAVVHRLFAIEGVIRAEPLSDLWLTLTGRAEGLMPEEAAKRFSSIYGGPTATLLPDGSGSLVRFRIPIEATPAELLQGVIHDCIEPEVLADDWVQAVGPFPIELDGDGSVKAQELDLPTELDSANLLVLGTGGLGSWATPLFAAGVSVGGLNLSLVDADDSVDMHNLNRQVLYTSDEVGMPKAPAAARRMRDILGDDPTIIAIQNRLEQRHTTPQVEIATSSTDGAVSLEQLVGEENVLDDAPLRTALEQMDIALACLDNQFARTMLNKCCISSGVPMVNGGGEAFSGVVEVFGDDTCMVCRYGRETAYAQEVISCQETGTRPVASIVTTTAWVGAMQAALALLKLSGVNGYKTGMGWDCGIVTERAVGSLPWVEGECSCHV